MPPRTTSAQKDIQKGEFLRNSQALVILKEAGILDGAQSRRWLRENQPGFEFLEEPFQPPRLAPEDRRLPGTPEPVVEVEIPTPDGGLADLELPEAPTADDEVYA